MKSSLKKQALLAKCVGIFALVLWISACSSSQTKEDDLVDDIPMATDAGTDALPQATAELPPVPTSDDPNVAEVAPPTLDSPSPAAMTPAANAPDEMQTEDYSVKQGDTLMKIAFEVYGDIYRWKEIYEKNRDKVSNPNSMPSGIVLKIDRPATAFNPEHNGEKYFIKEGDTLGKISDALYGTPAKWRALWENNKKLIQNPNRIFAGFYLYYLPDGAHPVVGREESSQTPDEKHTQSSSAPADSGLVQKSAEPASMDGMTGNNVDAPQQAAGAAESMPVVNEGGAEAVPPPPMPGS